VKPSVRLVSISLGLLMLSSYAQAAFICQSVDQNAEIRIVNTSADRPGSSKSLSMIVSDPHEKPGQQTRAIFRAQDGTLRQIGADYQAVVTSRALFDGGHGGRVDGVDFAEVQNFRIAIDLSFHLNTSRGPVFSGQATYLTASGQTLVQDFDCLRPESN
jgi:hypothetical protein